MCGRFSFSPNKKVIEEYYNIDSDNYKPQYNCAPTQNLAVITNKDNRNLNYYRWGFIPNWVKDLKKTKPIINAKSETIIEKHYFKYSFLNMRCLVPADSFFEWKTQSKAKIPYRIFLKNQNIFSMAGIWSIFSDRTNNIFSFAIITTKSNELMNPIHERMPVIINKEDEKKWLFSNDIEELLNICKPYSSSLMDCYSISSKVSNPVNNSPEILFGIK